MSRATVIALGSVLILALGAFAWRFLSAPARSAVAPAVDLTVVLVDGDNAEWIPSAEAVLVPDGESEWQLFAHGPGAREARWPHAAASGGRLAFPSVPAGSSWTLVGWLTTDPLPVVKSVAVPPTARQTYEPHLLWSQCVQTVTGVLVDPEGRPMMDSDIEWRLNPVLSALPGRTGATDGAGRFEFRIPRCQGISWSENEIRTMFAVELPTLRAVLGPLVDCDLLDLGLIRFEAMTLAAAGTVCDASGRPLTGLEVSGRTEDGATMETLTDASGRFRLELSDPVVGVTVSLDQPRHFPVFAPVEAGTSGLELTLRPCSTIRGALLLQSPPSMRREAFHQPSLEISVAADSESKTYLMDDRYFVEYLPPGLHTVQVRLNGFLAAEHHDVDLPAGEKCQDPRLTALDLRAGNRAVEFKVSKESSASFDDFFLRIQGDAGWFEKEILANVNNIVIFPERETRAWLGARGARTQEISLDSQSIVLRLERGIEAVLAVSDNSAVGCLLKARLIPLGVPDDGRKFANFVSRKSGRVALTLPAPGRYRIEFTLHSPERLSVGTPVPAARIVPAEITVAERGGTFPVTVDLAGLKPSEE